MEMSSSINDVIINLKIKMSSKTRQQIEGLLKQLRKSTPPKQCTLVYQKHIQYVRKVLLKLGESIIHFDVAQPWLYHYILHSLAMLGGEVSQEQKAMLKQAIKHCWNPNGGFGGGYLQQPHLAPTYAAFLAMIEMGPDAFDLADRQGLYSFFKRCKKGGRFQMHVNGECDLRGSYIVIIITKLLGLSEDILEDVAQTIIQSQTYQGGIANVIGGQAHGGFTFCGVAGLAAMGQLHKLDISRLMFWLSHRQVEFGGFNGRTSKLLDSCYSFWIGSTFSIVNEYFQGKCSVDGHLLYCQEDLKKYITLYCQDRKGGGIWDKPGKPRDIYHTCYGLSGLNLCLQSLQGAEVEKNEKELGIRFENIDPIYNVTKESLDCARQTLGKSPAKQGDTQQS